MQHAAVAYVYNFIIPLMEEYLINNIFSMHVFHGCTCIKNSFTLGVYTGPSNAILEVTFSDVDGVKFLGYLLLC